LALLFLLPLVGLAIDASLAFVVKARLSSACDAASLAAARSLTVGLSLPEQEASARARALAFFDANFPNGYFTTRNRTRTAAVAETGFRTRTVTVTASVDAPVYFMGMFGYRYMTVRAEGRASRRDINLILVLDRSSSMQASGSCAPMKTAARQFITMFANGRDRLGLIVFGASSILAFPPAQNFRTASPSMDTLIGQISCFGNTNMAQALSEAYVRLGIVNEPGALNIIVFFTDGLANGITAQFPVKMLTDTRYGYGHSPYTSTGSTYSMAPSTCQDSALRTYPTAGWAPAAKTGVLAQWSGFASTGSTAGLINPTQPLMSTTTEPAIADRAGCTFGSGTTDLDHVRRDIAYIPNTDAFGNNARCCYQTPQTFTSGAYSGFMRPDRPSSVGIASANAVDSAAQRMRNDAQLTPVIYAIGLGNPATGEQPDEVLMRRMSNDPTSPIYDNTKMEGLYVFATNNTQLSMAFYRIASEVLRIAR
jgi:Flp pilus assembly protein TadG